MEKRLNNLLTKMSVITTDENLKSLDSKARAEQASWLLIQIQILQHERLIHLIVTVTFAVLSLMSVALYLMIDTLALLLLCSLFIILLIPYIRHYYILENGVQKLYEYYDKLSAVSTTL